MIEIILAEPRGFCAGVERAIEIVEKAIAKYGAPVYVRHEIVHNKRVIEDLKAKGAVFVKETDQIPEGKVAIFSAHGVSEKVETDAKARGLDVIDATCPLVTKVHNQAKRYEKEGHEIILIGHAGHPEVEGTSGRVNNPVYLVSSREDVATLSVKNPDKLAYVTQTTLSVDDTKHIIDAIKERFPKVEGPDLKDICYATQNRQNAVKDLSNHNIDILLVIGAPNSSNSNRLRDLGKERGIESYLINDASELDKKWLDGKKKVGLTAGASAPEILVEEVIKKIEQLCGSVKVTLHSGVIENVKFRLPIEIEPRVAADV